MLDTPPPPQFSPPEREAPGPLPLLRSLPANIEPRSTLDPAQSHGRGLWSLNSRKENDQDHAVALPRLRSIVGTTAVGRAKNLPFSLSLPRSNTWPSSSAPDSAHRMGVVSGLSIVGKRIDQDHAAAPPRLRPIVGTTAVGRAKNLPFSLSLAV